MYYLGKKNKNLFRMTAAVVIIALVSSYIFPKEVYAARSRAGGGKIAKPDWGQVAKNVGITVGTVVISSGLSSAWNTAAPVNQSAGFLGKLGTDIANIPTTLGNLLTNTPGNPALIVKDITPWGQAFSSLNSLPKVAPIIAKGYTTYTAGTQVSRMVGMMGQYYEWSPKTTYALSHIGIGMTSGLLNPQGALGKTVNDTGGYGAQMVKAMTVGGLGGYATGATIYSIDGDKIKEGKSPGTGAQIAGLGMNMFATEFGRTLVNPDTYKNVISEGKVMSVYDFEGQPSEIYGPDYEFGEGAHVCQEEGQIKVLSPKSPEEVQQLKQVNPSMNIISMQEPSIKIIQGEYGGLQVIHGQPLGQYWVRSDINVKEAAKYRQVANEQVTYLRDAKGTVLMPVEEIGIRAGTKEVADALKLDGRFGKEPQEPSPTTVNELVNSDHARVVGVKGGYVQIGVEGEPSLEISLTKEQYDFASNLRQGLTPDSLYLLTGQPPTDHQIISRILVDPFVKTLDQWPILASRALAMNAYKKVDSSKDHSEWAPLASEVVFSTTASLFDTAANIWNLKPSLRFNTDEKFGYIPESKYQQVALVRNAVPQRFVSEVVKLPENASDDDIKAMLGKLEFNDKDQEDILKGFYSARNKIKEEQFDKKEQTKVLTRLIDNTIRDKFGNKTDLEVLKGIGGSMPEAFLNAAWNTVRYELPLSLASGSIQVGVNKNIKDDDFSGALAGLVASSIARGAVWHLYSQASDALTISGINKGKLNPEQIAAEFMPQSETGLIIERLAGNLPPLDDTEFVIVKRLFSGDKPQQDVEKEIRDLLPGKYPDNTPIFSETVSLDDIKREISDRYERDEQLQANLKKNEELKKQYFAFMRIKETVGIRKAEDGERGFSIGPSIKLGPLDKENNIIWTGGQSPDNKLRVRTYPVFKPVSGEDAIVMREEKLVEFLKENQGNQNLTISGGKIAITGEAKYGGQRGEVHYIPMVPDLLPTIIGSLSQGLFEFGWQSLAMGLPLTKGGSMSSYTWGNYVSQPLYNLTGAAAAGVSRGGGLFNTMTKYATSVGKDVIERNILTTAADTPLVGSALGIAPLIAVSGYKGMPFSMVAQIETGFKAQDTAFYPYWPYQRMSVVPHDYFWRDLKIGMVKQVTGQVIVPENKENGTKSAGK